MVLSIRCKEAFGSGMFRSVQISLINPLAITSSSNRLAISSLRSMRNLAYVVRHVAINRQYTKNARARRAKSYTQHYRLITIAAIVKNHPPSSDTPYKCLHLIKFG